MKRKLLLFFAFVLMASAMLLSEESPAQTKQTQSWSQWLKTVRVEALDQGIRPEVFDAAFKGIKAPHRSILNYDRNQPEHRLTFIKYRNTRADAFRIKLGRREYRKYSPLLKEVGRYYNVSPCFIVSFWGLETSYGRFMGKYPVIKSLATLAYDSRRSSFFRKQLFYALHILNDGHVKLKDFKGEWAGASGHPQFLPSSWHYYAVDYDKDGRRDIWGSNADVFASIANYLVKHGWKGGEPWAIPVTLPANFDQSLVNSKIKKSVDDWKALGLQTIKARPWPDGDLKAKLIHPDGGPDMLTFNNFDVIMKWNRSTYYAGTVGYMAEEICGRPLQ